MSDNKKQGVCILCLYVSASLAALVAPPPARCLVGVETLTHDKQEAGLLPDSGPDRWVRNLLILWVMEERRLPSDPFFPLPIPGSDLDLK